MGWGGFRCFFLNSQVAAAGPVSYRVGRLHVLASRLLNSLHRRLEWRTCETHTANRWCTESARQVADRIAEIPGLYCGPVAVGWIAAVWNIDVKKRSYDYLSRLANKKLFPDGPRKFHGKPPGFQRSLNDILGRETDGELQLWQNALHSYSGIHEELEKKDRPIIICMYPEDVGLHHVALYKSEKKEINLGVDQIKFYWMDNGLYGRRNRGHPGLYSTGWRKILSLFTWGAERVYET